MPVKRHQQYGAKKKKKKKMKTKPAHHFQVGYIHNQISIKIIYIYILRYKNRPKPPTAFKMTLNALYKNNEATLLKKTIEHHRKF